MTLEEAERLLLTIEERTALARWAYRAGPRDVAREFGISQLQLAGAILGWDIPMTVSQAIAWRLRSAQAGAA